MENIAAKEAKTHFGDMLLRVQREPISINKNGKPVAVIMSNEEYEYLEKLKLERLRAKLQKGVDQIKKGEVVDGEAFFEELLNEKGI